MADDDHRHGFRLIDAEDVKQEPLVFVDEDDAGGGDVWATPIEGLRESGPPPFLKKTYEMVDDPTTDYVISWSSTGTSFVVWDIHRLSADLLPKHFKHSNFSSFVRQLNTYRFRKIDSDRWEFANVGFQQGKKHLLKNIKRRKQSNDSTKCILEDDLDKLRSDHGVLKSELTKLRQQHDDTIQFLNSAHDRLTATEIKQKHMVLFLLKSLKNPSFLQRFIDRKRRKAVQNGGLPKKRRLTDAGSMEEMITNSYYDDTFEAGNMDESWSSENLVLWEKLMEDDIIYEGEEEETMKAEMVTELENLIAKPAAAEWGGVGVMVEPVGFRTSV